MCLGFYLLLLVELAIPICAEKYSDVLLPSETGKYYTKSSNGKEQLCHICPQNILKECGSQGLNAECRSKNPDIPVYEPEPWCNCGPVVGCDPLPDSDNVTYRCWPFGQVTGTVYQTCVPQCASGFRLTQGNGLRCGEDRKWNETVVPPICVLEIIALNVEVETLTPSTESSTPPDHGQRPVNRTGQEDEEPAGLNPIVLISGPGFMVVMVCVVCLCLTYNKGCHRCVQRKQSSTELTEIVSTRSTTAAMPIAPSSTSVNSSGTGADGGESTAASSSVTAASVHTSGNEDSDEEAVPLLSKPMVVAEPTSDPTGSAEKSNEDIKTGSGQSTLPTDSFPLTSGRTISVPPSWADPSKTGLPLPEREKDQANTGPQELQQTDGSQKLAALSIPAKQSTENVYLLDIDLCLPYAEPLTDVNDLLERHEPDGADSLLVDQEGESHTSESHTDREPHTPESHTDDLSTLPSYPYLKPYVDQDIEKTDIAEFRSPSRSPTVGSQALPVQMEAAGGHHQTRGHCLTGGHHQTGGHHLRRASDHHLTSGHHQMEAAGDNHLREDSDHHQRAEIIDADDCVTFSEYQDKRDALKFFSGLDAILVADSHEEVNWFGVSMWILCTYEIAHLPEKLRGLKETLGKTDPGSSYFYYVINNYFIAHGVKLGQVLYFYAKKYPRYKIKKLFKQFHPTCRYCEKFYEKS